MNRINYVRLSAKIRSVDIRKSEIYFDHMEIMTLRNWRSKATKFRNFDHPGWAEYSRDEYILFHKITANDLKLK